MKKNLLTFLCVSISFWHHAQELPPIRNFSPHQFAAENQNWDIAQSEERLIYVANNSGLLEYNGANWRLFPSPNQTIIRSVAVSEDRVYSGCYREFGYWEKDSFGNLNYTSLSNNIRNKLLEDEEFWSIALVPVYPNNSVGIYSDDSQA